MSVTALFQQLFLAIADVRIGHERRVHPRLHTRAVGYKFQIGQLFCSISPVKYRDSKTVPLRSAMCTSSRYEMKEAASRKAY